MYFKKKEKEKKNEQEKSELYAEFLVIEKAID